MAEGVEGDLEVTFVQLGRIPRLPLRKRALPDPLREEAKGEAMDDLVEAESQEGLGDRERDSEGSPRLFDDREVAGPGVEAGEGPDRKRGVNALDTGLDRIDQVPVLVAPPEVA